MSTAVLPKVTSWNIDPVHSVAEFQVKHMMISHVKGRFVEIRGAVALDDSDVTHSGVEASLYAASISTGDAQRDAHLRSGDFFDAEKFPALTFRSTRVVRSGKGELAVEGDLTIHGVTRRVVFAVEGPSAPVTDPYGKIRLGLSATAKINRKDFGLTWNAALETGGILIGDEVTIHLEVQFVKA
jgi:polyisoprenoid-binding protein YceI